MGVLAEGTPTLKSAKGGSTLRCQSTVINDVLTSWNVHYLYYFNGLTLFDRISEVNRT